MQITTKCKIIFCTRITLHWLTPSYSGRIKKKLMYENESLAWLFDGFRWHRVVKNLNWIHSKEPNKQGIGCIQMDVRCFPFSKIKKEIYESHTKLQLIQIEVTKQVWVKKGLDHPERFLCCPTYFPTLLCIINYS